MKKVFSFIFFPLLLAGCVNLDFVQSDSLSSAALAANPAAAEYTTDGVYALTKFTFCRQFIMMHSIKGDDICFSNTSTDTFWQSANYWDDANASDAGTMWATSYQAIYTANANISGLDEETPYNRQLKGENYFLRAFFHFNLCNLFAKPYSFGPENPGVVIRNSTDYSVTTRATVGECYDAIEADLLKAIELMSPEAKRGDNGYASKEAAQALLSRLYLYKGEWQKCIDICNELLGSDAGSNLVADIKGDLYQDAPNSKEVLWCSDLTEGDIAGWNPKSMLASMFDSPDGTQLTGWGELYVADPLLDLFERFPQDQRYTKMIRLHASEPGLFITFGEMDEVNGCLTQAKALPNVDLATGKITSSVTDNKDGTYSFSYNGKNYKAIPDNTSSKYSEEFPGYILNDGKNTRCYVRKVMPTPTPGTDVFEANGASIRPGGYPTWFCEKFSYQNNLSLPLCSSVIFIRYAEVVLNRAEAYAHLGKDAEALKDVNVIRTRAGLTGNAQMTSANLAKRGYANALDCVLDERRMELYYEGFRVTDLLRNKKDIDRRFPSRTSCELVPYNYPNIQYQIPAAETSVSGIPSNER